MWGSAEKCPKPTNKQKPTASELIAPMKQEWMYLEKKEECAFRKQGILESNICKYVSCKIINA